ncbi:hypothetical protein [Streptomyces sp. G-G2]|uniref:hypothetical protein n=1 Tax=Streptomyces sp. G-G2 TaxID=3046201 RepID=UPI0024BB148F|nr:hypothetical protein [Streptomyces sp. G-G2]MDJ0383480.1 hypothetical protein [Streptomyces sp. G-G2]
MNVEIVQAYGSDGGRSLVRFASRAGLAWGLWCGDGTPQPGEENVEVDIPDTIHSWSSTDEPDSLSGVPGSHLKMCGRVETADEGVVSIRIHSTVLLVEMDGNQHPAPGQRITFYAPAAHLYPYAL